MSVDAFDGSVLLLPGGYNGNVPENGAVAIYRKEGLPGQHKYSGRVMLGCQRETGQYDATLFPYDWGFTEPTWSREGPFHYKVVADEDKFDCSVDNGRAFDRGLRVFRGGCIVTGELRMYVPYYDASWPYVAQCSLYMARCQDEYGEKYELFDIMLSEDTVGTHTLSSDPVAVPPGVYFIYSHCAAFRVIDEEDPAWYEFNIAGLRLGDCAAPTAVSESMF